MRTQRSAATPGITVRFSTAGLREHVDRVARFERRSAAAYIEELVERDMRARDEADRVVRVHVAPGVPEPTGEVVREEGESVERHAQRTETLNALFGVRRT